VINGAMTSLPPQILVTADPSGKELVDVDWLIKRHAITVLPQVSSLKVLRGHDATASAGQPIRAYADPEFLCKFDRLSRDVAFVAALPAQSQSWVTDGFLLSSITSEGKFQAS